MPKRKSKTSERKQSGSNATSKAARDEIERKDVTRNEIEGKDGARSPIARTRTEIEEEPLGGEHILTPEEEQPMMSTGSASTWDYMPDPQVVDVLAETENVETAGSGLAETLRSYHSESPTLSAGDLDADWERANQAGEEAVGGTVATPDQDRVDDLGQALGIVYQDEEPLHTEDKLQKRDRDRWELNPASRETDAE